jgi:CDP-paratose 2-epimerase
VREALVLPRASRNAARMTPAGSGVGGPPRQRGSYLVTGGAGFIGCNLVDRLLRDGHDVALLDDLSRPGSRLNVDWLVERHGGDRMKLLEIDVREPEPVRLAVAEADVVFHLAAQTAVTTSIVDPRADLDINVYGTVNVLEAARSCRVSPVVVYASTNKVYGDLEDQGIVEEPARYVLPDLPHGIPEDTALGFTSPYACSKGAADQYVLAYAETYGIPAVSFRQSCIYGPRQMGMEDQGWAAWLILAGAFGRAATIFGDGKQVRDLLYIDDLVDAYFAAVDNISQARGRAYNIGGGPEFAVSIWHEFSALLRDLGYQTPNVEFASARQGDQRVYISDTRRTAADLGWKPTTPPAEGIGRMAEWIVTAESTLRPLLLGA